ncbi:MAG: N-acetyl-gamma-glutamyl-phosphate reductase [Deltaproteobacteria bacterium]|nr:N-acetyl-gamma-glutamyl-phosphate reductase [Deltaproteobacteria bacterium]
MKVTVIGGSGYVGGEIIRLVLSHPDLNLFQVTSERFAGKLLYKVHPNLRKATNLKFISIESLSPTDILFLALPHGEAQKNIKKYLSLAPIVIDLSSDFRLKDEKEYEKWYGHPHLHPELLKKFVYGLPEIHREEIKKSKWATGTGCLAIATILGLYPLYKEKLVSTSVIEGKIGSSAGGNKFSLATHHPERSGVVRSFQPTGHRHTAEMIQELSFNGEKPSISFSATSLDMVRGILITAHCFLNKEINEKDIWSLYRDYYKNEPFIRIVKEKTGIYRYPEPKILTGSNFCDIGFELDQENNRIVIMTAIDNMTKGAAGNGIQVLNIMCGFPENRGLEFLGMHPI